MAKVRSPALYRSGIMSDALALPCQACLVGRDEGLPDAFPGGGETSRPRPCAWMGSGGEGRRHQGNLAGVRSFI